MGLFGSLFSSSSSAPTKADKKKRIKDQYDFQIADAQRILENHKNNLANARWQLKMTKDKSWKRNIEQETYYIKQQQENLKRLKAAKAAALKNV